MINRVFQAALSASLAFCLCWIAQTAHAQGTVTSLGTPNLPSVKTLQVAAGGAAIPWQTNTTNKQSMTRSASVARDDLTTFQLIYPGWLANTTASATAEELPFGAASTISVGLEYPAGTITRVTFGGANTGTVPSGGLLTSDPIAVSIPSGARFWVRTWFSNSVGIFWSYRGTSIANGEGFEIGTTVTDKSVSGTVSTAIQSDGYLPVAIIAPTRKASVCGLGDSKVEGVGDLTDDAVGLRGNTERSVGIALPFLNLGTPGDRVNYAIQSGNYVNRTALLAYCTHAVVAYGVNDLNAGGRTAAQVEADLTTFATTFLTGKPYWFATVTPVTTSTDSWATTTNQTAFGNNAARVTLNNDIRLGLVAAPLGYFDYADAVESARDSGLWRAPTASSAGAFTGDGTHESTKGERAIQTSATIQPGLFQR